MNPVTSISSPPVADRYAADGYIILERLIPDKDCDILKQEAQRVLQEHARPTASVYVGAAVVSPLFRTLADDPRVVDVLRNLLPAGVMFLSDKIVFKSGTKTFASPWHIDAFYWPGTRPKLSVWIPLDDVTAANGTLKVVRGSHHRDWSNASGNTRDTNGEFDHVITTPTWEAADEVICTLPRGSAVFFSDSLVHASCPNTAGMDRYTIISTYHAPAADEPFDKDFPARHVIVPTPAP